MLIWFAWYCVLLDCLLPWIVFPLLASKKQRCPGLWLCDNQRHREENPILFILLICAFVFQTFPKYSCFGCIENNHLTLIHQSYYIHLSGLPNHTYTKAPILWTEDTTVSRSIACPSRHPRGCSLIRLPRSCSLIWLPWELFNRRFY